MSNVGSPSKSTYCVAICPFYKRSFQISSAVATKRPSPCEIATLWISPTSQPASHGDLLEAILVFTILDWCLAMVLNVSVGESSLISLISPYGTRPSLISAWKPLQIPSIRPSRFFSRSWIASVSLGFLRNDTMNLPEPSWPVATAESAWEHYYL